LVKKNILSLYWNEKDMEDFNTDHDIFMFKRCLQSLEVVNVERIIKYISPYPDYGNILFEISQPLISENHLYILLGYLMRTSKLILTSTVTIPVESFNEAVRVFLAFKNYMIITNMTMFPEIMNNLYINVTEYLINTTSNSKKLRNILIGLEVDQIVNLINYLDITSSMKIINNFNPNVINKVLSLVDPSILPNLLINLDHNVVIKYIKWEDYRVVVDTLTNFINHIDSIEGEKEGTKIVKN
jgi:hypothetical protein